MYEQSRPLIGNGANHLAGLYFPPCIALVLSHRVIAAIADGTAPADLPVTGLAKALPYSWVEQEQRLGLRPA
jgi:hypothetical protein